jgi:hypothetical protein
LEVILVSKITNIILICYKNSWIRVYFHHTATTTTTITRTTTITNTKRSTTAASVADATTTTTTTTYSSLQGLDYFKPILRLGNS